MATTAVLLTPADESMYSSLRAASRLQPGAHKALMIRALAREARFGHRWTYGLMADAMRVSASTARRLIVEVAL